jgi:Protein of unknown function (DUF2917)
LFQDGALRKILASMIPGNDHDVNPAKETRMKLDIHHQTFELIDEGLLAIREGQAARIRCLEGTLWITEEGEVKDTIVRSGGSYTLRHPGLAVLTSLGKSRITIDGPEANRDVRGMPAGEMPGLVSCA